MMKDIQDPERKENRAKIFEEIGELMDRYLKQEFAFQDIVSQLYKTITRLALLLIDGSPESDIENQIIPFFQSLNE
jgi:hypothetical protein